MDLTNGLDPIGWFQSVAAGAGQIITQSVETVGTALWGGAQTIGQGILGTLGQVGQSVAAGFVDLFKQFLPYILLIAGILILLVLAWKLLVPRLLSAFGGIELKI